VNRPSCVTKTMGWPDFGPTTHKVAKIDPKSFDLIAGSYQIAPQFVLTFSRDGDHYFSRATNQEAVEIFPDSERQYFSKAVGQSCHLNTIPKDDLHGLWCIKEAAT